MEITILSKQSLRIKSKKSTIVIDPTVKTIASAVLILDSSAPIDTTKVEGSKVIIEGPGEYEVEGMKISAAASSKHLLYTIRADDVDVLIGKGETFKIIQEKAQEAHIVICSVNTVVDSSFIPAFSPRIAAFYGEKAIEVAKSLKNEGITKTSKIQTTYEKLPEEMEVIVLG